jgi:hypothetical protein
MQGSTIRSVDDPEIDLANRRGAGSVIYTLVGFVAGCAAMLGSLALLHADVVDRGGTPSTTAAAQTGDNADALLEHVPPSVSGSCTSANRRAAATENSVYASVVCHPADVTGVTVQYMSVHDAYALRQLFNGQLQQNELMLAPTSSASKACASRPDGAFRWYGIPMGSGMTGAVVHDYRPGPGATHGEAACYVDNNLAWIDWIDYDTHIYAFASTDLENYQTLFQWWREQAGPFHPRHALVASGASAQPSMATDSGGM